MYICSKKYLEKYICVLKNSDMLMVSMCILGVHSGTGRFNLDGSNSEAV